MHGLLVLIQGCLKIVLHNGEKWGFRANTIHTGWQLPEHERHQCDQSQPEALRLVYCVDLYRLIGRCQQQTDHFRIDSRDCRNFLHITPYFLQINIHNASNRYITIINHIVANILIYWHSYCFYKRYKYTSIFVFSNSTLIGRRYEFLSRFSR